MADAVDGLDAVVRAVLDGLSEGVVVLDRGWTYRYVNAAAAAFLHTSPEALVGEGYYELYPEAVGTPFESAYRRVMDSGVSETVDDYYEPWDQYFRNVVLPYPEGIVILFSDVTEEGRRNAADRRARALLQQVVDFAPIGIVLEDRAGRYVLVNRFAAERTGQPAEAMLGRSAASYVSQRLQAEWSARAAFVMRTGQPVDAELVVPDADGEVHHYRTVVFPTYDEDGTLNGTGAIYHDVTPRD